MTGWRCPKCNSENSGDEACCAHCGERRETGASSLLNSIRTERKGLFKASRASLESFRAEISKLPEPTGKLPSLEQLMTATASVAAAAPAASRPAAESIARVTTRNLQVRHNAHPRLNYALAHCGLPLIPSLEITNSSAEAARDVLVKAWVATDYGEPWQKTLPAIPGGQTHVETEIFVPLHKSRLQEVREAERANLRIDVFTEGELQVCETYPVEVLAYNEWYYNPRFPQTVASFVQPNCDAIEKTVSLVRDRLKREDRDTSLDGYQSGNPGKILEMLGALFAVLQSDLQLTYINPPPSFEGASMLPDGSLTISQKIFFPEQILEHRRGTCMDLALFCAACVERMGLHPIWFMIHGHAFFGAWLAEKSLQNPVVTDHAAAVKLVSEGAWFPLNSTTFTLTPPRQFMNCVEEATCCLMEPERFICAVDIQSARAGGIKPIPPLVDGA